MFNILARNVKSKLAYSCEKESKMSQIDNAIELKALRAGLAIPQDVGCYQYIVVDDETLLR